MPNDLAENVSFTSVHALIDGGRVANGRLIGSYLRQQKLSGCPVSEKKAVGIKFSPHPGLIFTSWRTS